MRLRKLDLLMSYNFEWCVGH